MKITFKYLIGKTILVGLTYLDSDGSELEKIQFHGVVLRADKDEGIVIKKANSGEEFILPPDLNSIVKANPGEYCLHSSGEIVVNPELLTTWTIRKT